MSLIYEPKGRAREYAPLAINHYIGCSHGCLYCYVPTIPPYKFQENPRQCFHGNPRPRPGVVEQLERECSKNLGTGQRVLLSFTTDPYQPIDETFHITRQVIQVLHRYGYFVQVLTKGGSRALYDLDIFTKHDAFASTMTLLSDEHTRKWEPGAALPSDRIYTLLAFHEAGIPTWVSLEPVLNPDSALEIIRQTYSFVDLFKIGKINHHPLESRIDWHDFVTRAVALCESLNVRYYVKDDLAEFLQGAELGPYHITVAELERPGAVLSQRHDTHGQDARTQPQQSQTQRMDLQSRLPL